jgi:small subunit ribosomal protein S8
MLDPIADMLTRIRNAQRAGKKEVTLPYSKMKQHLAEVLLQEGFVDGVRKEEGEKFPQIAITLKYTVVSQTKKRPAINEITRVSKEGCRIYVQNNQIQKVKNGFGIAIISTSRGIMTGGEAFSKGLGGEYICKVW